MLSTQTPVIQSLIAKVRAQEEAKRRAFPITNLLQLYAISSRSLYLNHMEGLRLLIAWLSPISPSEKPSIYIPTYLLTYEMQEIAKLTGNHISQIYQELTELWTRDY